MRHATLPLDTYTSKHHPNHVGVTSADIAERAGVSRATVSYVLNDNPRQSISPATRATVLQAARDLGYRPNVAAQALRSGRGRAVVFPLPGLGHTHIVTQLIGACQSALDDFGLALVADHTAYESVDAQLDAWLKHSPAAVIDLLLPHGDPVLPALRSRGIQVLSSAMDTEAGWESTSDALARECRLTQITHLLDRGATDIAIVVPPILPTDPRTQRAFLAQVRRLAKQRGARVRLARVRLDSTAVSLLVDRWVADPGPRPDAVAAHNDDYAIAVQSALLAHGVRVPDDVQVMGVDDIPLARAVTPSLTSITADFAPYGRAVAAAVMNSLAKRSNSTPLPLPSHHLVVRSSTRSES